MKNILGSSLLVRYKCLLFPILNSFQGHFFTHHLTLELEKQGLVGSVQEKVIF